MDRKRAKRRWKRRWPRRFARRKGRCGSASAFLQASARRRAESAPAGRRRAAPRRRRACPHPRRKRRRKRAARPPARAECGRFRCPARRRAPCRRCRPPAFCPAWRYRYRRPKPKHSPAIPLRQTAGCAWFRRRLCAGKRCGTPMRPCCAREAPALYWRRRRRRDKANWSNWPLRRSAKGARFLRRESARARRKERNPHAHLSPSRRASHPARRYAPERAR